MKPGCTATDLVLTVTEMLRKKGVVEKFVEFFGDGLANLPLADRATIANMAPEYGSTCGIFPIDEETIRYLELSGRPREQIELVEAYAKAQGMWRLNGAKPADYTDVLELDLATVEPSLRAPSVRRIACAVHRPRLSIRLRSRAWPKSEEEIPRLPRAAPKSSSMASRWRSATAR
jgi:aconitase A